MNSTGPVQWDDVLSGSPNIVPFWYRESPRLFRPYALIGGGRVNPSNPEMTLVGMTSLLIGLDGELLEFRAVPPTVLQTQGAPAVDWSKRFALARLDQSKFQPADPQWSPLAATDGRVAWTGVQRTTHKQPTDIPIRVEAASFAGRPVYFQIIYPWTVAPGPSAAEPSRRWVRNLLLAAVLLLIGSVLFGSLYMALHYLKTGSADSAEAVRVGAYMGAINLAGALLGADVGDMASEFTVIQTLVGASLLVSVIFAVFYLPLEPWVRKSWPHVLITWSRILQGHWTDPMVGRDALFGVGLGVFYSLVFQGLFETMVRDRSSLRSFGFQIRNVLGFNQVLPVLLGNLETGIGYTIALLWLFFFLRFLLRKQWLAAIMLVVAMALYQTDNSSVRTFPSFVLNFIIFGLLVGTLMRLGAVAAVVLIFVANSTSSSLFTTDYSAWYGTSSWVLLLICASLALWGYRVAVAGKPLLDERRT